MTGTQHELIYVCPEPGCWEVCGDGLWDATDLAEKGPPACPQSGSHGQNEMQPRWVVELPEGHVPVMLTPEQIHTLKYDRIFNLGPDHDGRDELLGALDSALKESGDA